MSRLLGPRWLTLLFGLTLAVMVRAESADWPETHPCTGAPIPLSTERDVVQAAECLFKGRVVKVERAGGGDDWVYRLRILLNEGRVKTVDLHPQTGLPTDPAVLEEVYEALGR